MSTFGAFSVVRSTVKRVLNSSGVLAEVAVNTPAFEFNADGTYRGLLVEPAATNLLVRSQEFDNASWVTDTNRPTITANATTAPDGTMTADRMVITAAGGFQGLYQDITVVSGQTYTFSFWVKNNTGSGSFRAWVDLSGTPTTPLVVTPTSEWVRYSVTSTVSDTSARVEIARSLPATDLDCFIWGAQLETGSVATSYIPTTASTANRTADVITLSSASSLIGQTEGTLYAEIVARNFNSATTIRRLLTISDGTTSNRIGIASALSQDYRLQGVVVTGGSTVAQIIQTSNNTQDAVIKSAIGYKLDDVAFYVNGSSIGTDTSATIPTCNRIDIGNQLGGEQFLNGWIRSVALFPTRLSNAQLQALTT